MSDHAILNATPDDLERSAALKAYIIEEIEGSPNGQMTFGRFADLSIYGNGSALPGYYSNPAFRPNDGENIDGQDTFVTLAGYPDFGKAVGEIIAEEMCGFTDEGVLHLIEIGGGDGVNMLNVVKGAVQNYRHLGELVDIQPTMIDRTAQLLERQRRTVNGHRIVQPEFINARMEDITGPIHKLGAVLSNELLDMLPFEVAADGSKDPQMVYVTNRRGELSWTIAAAKEEYAEEAARVIKANPHKDLQSFQPQLLPTMKKIAGLIEHGVVVTMDYAYGYEPDVQIMRNGVPGSEHLTLNYPGLFDISVVPDWGKIVQWAKARYGEANVELDHMDDFLTTAPSYPTEMHFLPKLLKKSRKDPVLMATATLAMHASMASFSALVIRT